MQAVSFAEEGDNKNKPDSKPQATENLGTQK